MLASWLHSTLLDWPTGVPATGLLAPLAPCWHWPDASLAPASFLAPWPLPRFLAPWPHTCFLAPRFAFWLPGPTLVFWLPVTCWLHGWYHHTGLLAPWHLQAPWHPLPTGSLAPFAGFLPYWLPVTCWLHGWYHPALAYWLPWLPGTCRLPGTHCLLAPWPLAGFLPCWLPVLPASCLQAPWLHTHFLVFWHHIGLLAPCPLVGFTSTSWHDAGFLGTWPLAGSLDSCTQWLDPCWLYGLMLAFWVHGLLLAPWTHAPNGWIPAGFMAICHHAPLLASWPHTTIMAMLVFLALMGFTIMAIWPYATMPLAGFLAP